MFCAASTCVTARPRLAAANVLPPVYANRLRTRISARRSRLHSVATQSQFAACSGKTPTWPNSVSFKSNCCLPCEIRHGSGSRSLGTHLPRAVADCSGFPNSNRAWAERQRIGDCNWLPEKLRALADPESPVQTAPAFDPCSKSSSSYSLEGNMLPRRCQPSSQERCRHNDAQANRRKPARADIA